MPIREAAIPAIISSTSVRSEEAGLPATPSLPSPSGEGKTDRAELRAIAAEKDPELRRAALCNFAARQERKGRFAAAAAIYESILNEGEDRAARRRLLALRSQGSFGDRAEILLGDFFRQATSLEMLGGMAAGSLVGQGLRALTLSRLLGGEAAFFTRGVGARTLAVGTGLVGEVPAVLLASKGLQEAGGHSAHWDVGSLGRESLALGMSLGLLKAGAAFSSRIGGNFNPGSSLAARLNAGVLPQASAGIALFAAHRLESRIGLRPPSDAGSALIDSAAMLFQFQIGNRLLHSATGGALARSLGELDLRSRFGEKPRFPQGPRAFSQHEYAGGPVRRAGLPSTAELAALADPSPKLKAEKSEMSSLGDAGGSDSFLYRRLLQRLSEKLDVPLGDGRLRSIVDNYWAIPFHHHPANSRGEFFNMLGRTELEGSHFLEGREMPAIDLMQSASLILRRAMEMNPFRGGSGSFYDFLTQVAFEQTLASTRVPAFDALIHTLTVEPKQSALEAFFKSQELHHPFTRQVLATANASMDLQPWLRRLEAYPISEETRWWLAEYLVSYNHGLFAMRYRDGAYNYFYPRNSQGPSAMTTETVFHALNKIFANPAHHQVWRNGLRELVRRADKSPVPLLYFDRFFKLVASDDIQEKVSELVLGSEFNALEVWQMERMGLPIDGTVYTGFLSDPVLAAKFQNFYRALPELIHPQRSEERLAEYRLKARDLLEGKINYDQEEILELLYHRPTARAAEARQAILKGEIGLEVLTRSGMETLMRQLRPGRPIAKLHDALYLPASKSPTGLPYIAILQLDPRLSREEKIARAPYLAAYAVHEYDHHLYFGELDINQRSQRLKAEMRAWLEENLYLLTQGEKTVWEEAEILSPNGFGIYLRSLIEREYLQESGDYLQRPATIPPRQRN